MTFGSAILAASFNNTVESQDQSFKFLPLINSGTSRDETSISRKLSPPLKSSRRASPRPQIVNFASADIHSSFDEVWSQNLAENCETMKLHIKDNLEQYLQMIDRLLQYWLNQKHNKCPSNKLTFVASSAQLSITESDEQEEQLAEQQPRDKPKVTKQKTTAK